MLKVDPTLNHIPARREHVIALYESINQPLVNIPNFGTAPTGAFVLGTRNDQGYYTVFVYLYQPETRAVVIYVSEPRNLTNDQYRAEENEGVRFVESMGFMIDNVHFPTLAPPEQETVMGRVPLFRPPERTVDLYELADDRPRGPGFAPAQPSVADSIDALFGGLSQADGDVFRRAGLPPSPSNRPNAPSLRPGPSGPPSYPPNPTFSGSGFPGLSNPPGPKAPPPLPGPLSPAAGLPPLGFGSGASPSPGFASPPPGFTAAPPGAYAPPPASTPYNNLPPGFTAAPAPTPDRRPEPGAGERGEGLDRLGRLLGAFGWALVVWTMVAPIGCKSGGTGDGEPQSGSSTEANVDLGNQMLAQGRWPDAIQTFDEVLKTEETQKDALRGTGLAYLNLGRVAEAEGYYRKAIESDPKYSIAKNELAVVLMSAERCSEAEPLLREVLEDIFYTTPEFAEHNLARAIACQGRVEEAAGRLERLMVKRPYFCLGYLTLAQLSSQAKKPEMTITACDDFARNCEAHEEIKNQISPEQSAMCYLQKGMAHAALGDVESARASFERCQPIGVVGKECRKSLEMLNP
jgi:Tfp pilus assembly protein PilF